MYDEMPGGSPILTLSGEVAAVIFTNEENGYAVLDLEVDDGGRITVAGCIPYPGEGESLTVEGIFKTHPTYGTQFSCTRVERRLPASAGAILRYLSMGALKGIGPATARKIVDRFGTETFDVLEHWPERLLEIKGITEKRARETAAEFSTKLALQHLMSFFAQYDLDPALSLPVYKTYGASAIERITENPYLLTGEPFFIHFTAVDRMALILGFATDDYLRIEAAVIFELYFNQNQGHVYLPFERLCDVTSAMLSLPKEPVSDCMEMLIDAGKVICEEISGDRACYLPSMHKAECFVAQRLAFLASRDFEAPRGIEQALAKLEQDWDVTYADGQRNAIVTALSSPVMILTGGPGTGKTTAVRGMLALLDGIGSKTVLAAPTGRAAKRLSELCGREAKTIHRLLEVVFTSEGLEYAHHEQNPLPADTVIVDELSMVDLPLMAALLAAIKNGCRLILVGDPDQLPSVGPGTVLKDLLDCNMLPRVHLHEIFRQARESDIIVNAHKVNRGEMPSLRGNKKDFFFMQKNRPTDVIDTVLSLVEERLPKNMGFDPADIQVITPSRKQETGVTRLNPLLQAVLNPPHETKREKAFGGVIFREGDRVMQIRNNYDMVWKKEPAEQGQGIFNGDIGVIRRISFSDQTLTVDFDDRICQYEFDMLDQLEHAYAITVHKAQGCEFPAVIFVASLRQSRLLNRNLFYTAITRARSLLVIVGNAETVHTMVTNQRRQKRYGGLCHRLKGFANPASEV